MKKILFCCALVLVLSCKKDKDDDKIAAPVAKFSIQANDGIAPETIKFTNQSENAEDFIWFFDDGQASMENSPSHMFKRGGEYTVLLKVFGPGGKDSIVKTIELVEPQTLYQVKNCGELILENVRSFYLDWDESKVYEIIEHGDLGEGEISEAIPTSKPSIEVLFFYQEKYFQLVYPDAIIADQLNTINIYDTSSCWWFEEDPISSSSLIDDFNKKLIKVKELIK